MVLYRTINTQRTDLNIAPRMESLNLERTVPCAPKEIIMEMPEKSSSESESNYNVDRRKRRLERNKQSARESRKRKKEYVHRLEEKVIFNINIE